ncbi:MAG: hypothetical protein ACHQ01_02045 [Candidatus Limnocylindrales bacterium]
MAQVTDSFCERCGSRYVFSPNAPKSLSLKGARVLAKGLKNFVLNDGQSMSDSITLARLDDDRADSTRIDEAFHRTFNFCMTCRQYACDRCWNSTVGACLSCAPEHSVEPIAPEGHLIVRTPVARWDSDWSLEPDGPSVGPFGRPAMNQAPEDEPSVASAWPARDLPAGGPGFVPGASQSPNRSTRKPGDVAAWSLWPVADEISPEMTLTPEELAIVEVGLGRSVHPVPAAAESDAEEVTQNDTQTPAWVSRNVEPWPASPAAAEPVLEAEPVVAAAPAVSEPLASQPLVATQLEPTVTTPPVTGPEPELASPWAVERQADSGRPVPVDTPADEPPVDSPDIVGADVPEPEAQHRVLRMSHADAEILPLANPMSRPGSQGASGERVPMATRLFGRRAPAAPDGNPWPHPTLWTDRPIEVNDWWGDAVAAAAVVDMGPARQGSAAPASASIPAASAAPLAVPTRSDVPTAIAGPTQSPESAGPTFALPPAPGMAELSSPADSRQAATLRLSAVAATSDGSDGATEQGNDGESLWATPDPAPVSTPAVVQRPLFDMPTVPQHRAGAAGTDAHGWLQGDFDASPADRGPVQAPWPPIGAQWPSTQKPTDPWPAPATAPVPAAVAAHRLGAPRLAEMWAQSAQEVLNRGGVRVCHKCALPVSTHARYCRRCGTQQA